MHLQGIIFPVTETFRTEWINTDDFIKPAEWKSSVIPFVKQPPQGEKQTACSELSMAIYMKREHFVIVELGNSEPETLGRQLKVSDQFRGFVMLELPMETRENDHGQWLKWHKFHSAANFNPKFKVWL